MAHPFYRGNITTGRSPCIQQIVRNGVKAYRKVVNVNALMVRHLFYKINNGPTPNKVHEGMLQEFIIDVSISNVGDWYCSSTFKPNII